MDVYGIVPFLAILEKRRDLLPEDPVNVDEQVLTRAQEHLRSVLYGRVELAPTSPYQFFVEANLVAFSPSPVVWERFAKYYADLSLPAFTKDDPVLRRHYPVKRVIDLPDFLSVRRPYEEIKLYHLEVEGGKVFLGDKEPYFAASLLFRDILLWLKNKVRRVVASGALDALKDVAMKVLAPPVKGTRKYGFIKRLMGVTGLPDGRKRVLFYWLIPYWVTVEGRSPDEVLELANEWIARQGGAKIYASWILSEAENVRAKGIKPWSLAKVERVDPELIRLLRGMGVL